MLCLLAKGKNRAKMRETRGNAVSLEVLKTWLKIHVSAVRFRP
jgi:hypothetical protein